MARVTKQQQQGPKRAAIYTRVSTSAQDADDKISLSEQEADCRAYCGTKGYEVVAVYTDVKSGTTSKRPDFQKMIDAAGAESFDIVVCWKVDRLGRGLYPMARLLEALEKHSITIEAVKEQVDQRYLGLFASVGAIELQNIRERTMNMRRAYARQGFVANGITPYGYRVTEDGRPEVDADEAAILVEIAQRYSDGELVESICADLRAREVPSRRPHLIRREAWQRAYLRRLLADEGYASGQRTYGGETVPFPVIFPPDLWQAITSRRDRNRKTAKRNTQYPYLCQHLLWCRCCGLRFFAYTRTHYTRKRNGETIRFPFDGPRGIYKCVGSKNYRYDCRPGANSMPAHRADTAVWNAIAEALHHPENLLQGVQARLDELEQTPDVQDVYEADRQIARLKVERLEIVRQRARGKIDDATQDVLLGEIDTQTTYWQERFEAESGLRADLEGKRRALEHAREYLDGLRSHVSQRMDEMTPEERKQLIQTLVDRIWVETDGGLVIEGIIGASANSATGVQVAVLSS